MGRLWKETQGCLPMVVKVHKVVKAHKEHLLQVDPRDKLDKEGTRIDPSLLHLSTMLRAKAAVHSIRQKMEVALFGQIGISHLMV